jgi:hypothetical protein
MERIKSFEEACKAQGLDPEKVLPDVSNMPEHAQKTITAYAKLCIIQPVLNGDWKPDWNDYNQYKYYPWFDVNEDQSKPSGFGLSFYDYGYDYTLAYLGSRLYYKDRETAEYAGETFIAEYEDLVLQPK